MMGKIMYFNLKKHHKNKPAPPPGLPPEEKPPVKEQPKKQPFLKRLLFGEEYGLHVYSMPGMGTTVEIHLPIITSDRDIANKEVLG